MKSSSNHSSQSLLTNRMWQVLFAVFIFLLPGLGFSNKANTTASVATSSGQSLGPLALQYRCYHWKRVCEGKMRCIEYSYSYSGCYLCSIYGYSERYKRNLTDRRETCQYSRKRYFERIGYKCKQYYYDHYSAYSGSRHCVRWTRHCRYICKKWSGVPKG